MAALFHAAKFHESLIFELVERLLDYGLAAKGEHFRLDLSVIDLLRRAAATTEGFPSQAVQEAYKEIFLRDVWEKLPANQRRPGVLRRFTADRLELASLAD